MEHIMDMVETTTRTQGTAAMIATLLSALFAASAVLAITAIVDSWRRHGSAMLALRGELKACRQSRELRYVLVTTEVREIAPRPAMGRFRAATAGLPLQTGLRAA